MLTNISKLSISSTPAVVEIESNPSLNEKDIPIPIIRANAQQITLLCRQFHYRNPENLVAELVPVAVVGSIDLRPLWYF